jgi:hypothetical protein
MNRATRIRVHYLVLAFWSALTGTAVVTFAYAVVIGTILLSELCLAACLVIYVYMLTQSRRSLARELARRDLREAYPPRRDAFHRDLERLERLRGHRDEAQRSEMIRRELDQADYMRAELQTHINRIHGPGCKILRYTRSYYDQDIWYVVYTKPSGDRYSIAIPGSAL